MRLIDADALCTHVNSISTHWLNDWSTLGVLAAVEKQPTIDAVPVTAAELRHLINDTIAYMWDLEDKGIATPLHGYDSRKALLEKLKRFEKEHFPEWECSCGERKDGAEDG